MMLVGHLSFLGCFSLFGRPEQPVSDSNRESAPHLPSSLSYMRRVDGVIQPRSKVSSILQGGYFNYPPFPANLSPLRCNTTIPTKPYCHSGTRFRARPFQVRAPMPDHCMRAHSTVQSWRSVATGPPFSRVQFHDLARKNHPYKELCV